MTDSPINEEPETAVFDPSKIVTQKVPVPVRTRATTPKVNPFQDLADSLIIGDGAVTFEVPKQFQTYTLEKIRAAAPDRTIRSNVEGDQVTVWAIKRIVRTRKNRTEVTDKVNVLYTDEGYAIIGEAGESMESLEAQKAKIDAEHAAASLVKPVHPAQTDI